jgi:phospholipase C
MTDQDGTHPIRHVVVLMLENHSFDQMLGDFQSKYADLDGIDRSTAPRTNVDSKRNVYSQAPTRVRSVNPDPHHELAHVLRQIEAEAPAPGNYSLIHHVGRAVCALIKVSWSYVRPTKPRFMAKAPTPYRGDFVRDYAESYPATTKEQRQTIMGFYERGALPALHTLAEHFLICDRWFASVPGPTWTNRFFVHSGTSRGIARMPDNKWDWKNYDIYDQTTIYERLNQQNVSWRIYYHDVPQSFMLANQLQRENKRRYVKMDRFERDVAGPAEDFPRYVFIEPQYLDPDPNDDHPPYDVYAAQRLSARVYNAIRANEALWNRTLLVILYDEHGGFYDHVRTPIAVAPDDFVTEEYSFDRLGVRVPALLVSPWVHAGVCHVQMDHTSLLRYVSDRWKLQSLGHRVDQAQTFENAIHITGRPRTDTPVAIPADPPESIRATTPAGPTTTPSRSENQQALHDLSIALESRVAAGGATSPPKARYTAARKTDSDSGAARVQSFIDAD